MPTFRLGATLTVLSFALLWACDLDDEAEESRFPIIPIPSEIEEGRGSFRLDGETEVTLFPADDPELTGLVTRWVEDLRARTDLPLPILDEEDARSMRRIQIRLMAWESGRAEAASPAAPLEKATGTGLPGVQAEGYELDVTRRGIELEASGRPGIYYGLQTLSQLLPLPGSPEPLLIPAVEIEDEPRFPYRGMHLDVGRHFFPASFIKRYIDLLATYKMNVFHWHLTEDQGWRLEIDGYPRLTEIGSCRAETIVEKNFDPFVGDGIEYCGFYTKDEVREIVAYARERFITVMPEIELPGHSVAALAAYPELGCTPGPFQVHTRWGVTRDIYCPKEETFDFLEGVFTEVMELFPSEYIHIGGDEAPKTAWEESELAQEVMRREGLANEEELQSWFIRRIERFLRGHGRRLVGWDEILEGGLAPDATVMSWRGEDGGIQAAREGHDVIMTPNSTVYLDYYQGDPLTEPLAIGGYSPLEKVYAYEPVPGGLSLAESAFVLGAQGNVWTEYMASSEHVEYMVLPRLLALSEVVWSPSRERDWEGFSQRLPHHLARLEDQGVNFRVPDVLGLENDRLVLTDSAQVALGGRVPGGTIRYTLGGSDPDPTSPIFDEPFHIPVDEEGVQLSARMYLASGREGPIRRARLSRTHLAAPVSLPLESRARGLSAQAFSGRFRNVDALEGGEPIQLRSPSSGEAASSGGAPSNPRVSIPEEGLSGSFGLVLTGFVRVPRKGIYTFYLSSDDGSRLTVGNQTVVDHDGPHSMSERAGAVALHRGWHPIQVRYFEAGGAGGLRLEVEGPGVTRREVPANWFAHLQENGDPDGGIR